MKEGGRFDRYFSRKDTLLVKTIQRISPKTGSEYRRSRIKRLSDIGFALSFSALYGPQALIAKRKVRRESGVDPIYIQDRILGMSHDEGYTTFQLRKIRTMRVGSDKPELFGKSMYTDPNHDPRLLKGARIMRYRRIDEFPQLGQVLRGEMSFIGVRAMSPKEWNQMSQVLGENFAYWSHAYFNGKPSYLSLAKVKDLHRTGDRHDRYYWDTKYAEKANLGIDLFIFYRSFRRFFQKSSLA